MSVPVLLAEVVASIALVGVALALFLVGANRRRIVVIEERLDRELHDVKAHAELSGRAEGHADGIREARTIVQQDRLDSATAAAIVLRAEMELIPKGPQEVIVVGQDPVPVRVVEHPPDVVPPPEGPREG